MPDGSNDLESLKLISDWGKWLITIEMACIAVIGTIVKDQVTVTSTRILATLAVTSFLASIGAAAILLLSLPEIAQGVRPGTNIWMTRDSVLGRVLGVNTQDLAIAESFFFGLGVCAYCGLIVAIVWKK